jgi:Fe-S-cluster containining protein
MNKEEFIRRVGQLSEARSSIWVELPFVYTAESTETVKILMDSLINCQYCGKCCNGEWFKIVPLFLSDYRKILNQVENVFKYEEISQLVEFNGQQVTCLTEPCHFLKDGKCSIYEYRPITCKKFPILVDEKIKINVNCPAGMEIYLKLADHNKFELDSEGLE